MIARLRNENPHRAANPGAGKSLTTLQHGKPENSGSTCADNSAVQSAWEECLPQTAGAARVRNISKTA